MSFDEFLQEAATERDLEIALRETINSGRVDEIRDSKPFVTFLRRGQGLLSPGIEYDVLSERIQEAIAFIESNTKYPLLSRILLRTIYTLEAVEDRRIKTTAIAREYAERFAWYTRYRTRILGRPITSDDNPNNPT